MDVNGTWSQVPNQELYFPLNDTIGPMDCLEPEPLAGTHAVSPEDLRARFDDTKQGSLIESLVKPALNHRFDSSSQHQITTLVGESLTCFTGILLRWLCTI